MEAPISYLMKSVLSDENSSKNFTKKVIQEPKSKKRKNTETLTVHPKGDGVEIIVQHDQSGSAYGIDLSKSAYEQLRLHFVSVECEHPYAYVHTRCMGEINYCLKCGKDL